MCNVRRYAKARNEMVSNEFLDKLKGKRVHVDFVSSDGEPDWVEGILSDYEWIDEGGYQKNLYIEITSDTDYDRISGDKIKKIYLKEQE